MSIGTLVASLGQQNQLGYKGQLWHSDPSDLELFNSIIAGRAVVTGRLTALLMRGKAFSNADSCYVLTRTNSGLGDYEPITIEGIASLNAPVIAGAYQLLAGCCSKAIITRWPASVTGPADTWLSLEQFEFKQDSTTLCKTYSLELWSKNA